MKRVVPIIICMFLTLGAAGYKGSLPNIEGDFAYKRTTPEIATPPFSIQNNSPDAKLKEVPREDKKYIEIIVKRDKSSQYINDTNTILSILNKLQNCIINEQDIQKFNAIVSNLIDHISSLQEDYSGKPEENYISFKALMSISQEARNTAILRTESAVYTKYLPYSSSGSTYKPSNVKKQIASLSSSIDQTIYVLKNLD